MRVREGRGIYANIKKVVGFLLGTNIGEIITVFAAMLLWHKTAAFVHAAFVDQPGNRQYACYCVGYGSGRTDIMEQKPKPKNEGIFAHGLGVRVVLQGFMFGILTLIGFQVGEQVTGNAGWRTDNGFYGACPFPSSAGV